MVSDSSSCAWTCFHDLLPRASILRVDSGGVVGARVPTTRLLPSHPPRELKGSMEHRRQPLALQWHPSEAVSTQGLPQSYLGSLLKIAFQRLKCDLLTSPVCSHIWSHWIPKVSPHLEASWACRCPSWLPLGAWCPKPPEISASAQQPSSGPGEATG